VKEDRRVGRSCWLKQNRPGTAPGRQNICQSDYSYDATSSAHKTYALARSIYLRHHSCHIGDDFQPLENFAAKIALIQQADCHLLDGLAIQPTLGAVFRVQP
jgi:hypothetical protein